MKKFLFVAGLLSLALAIGCAKGGKGPCVNNCPAVSVDDNQQIVAGVNLSIAFTATVTGTSQTALTWSITGASCSGSGNPCGTLTNVTNTSATYNAPATLPSNPVVTVVAALQSDSTVSGSQDLTIIPDTANVTPGQLNIGLGLTQQFAATAVPDPAPQNFTWSCMANGLACANFTPGPNGVGTAVYTPVAAEKCGNNCVQISAVATVDPTGCQTPNFTCASPKFNVVSSRAGGTYAFQFSGFDNSGKPVIAAGTFTADPNTGAITGGVEDVYTSAGPNQYAITGGSYTPNTSVPNSSNNAGTLNLAGGTLTQFQVVMDGAGDMQMIESDGNGSGSGYAESTAKNQFSQNTNQTFAFGFTGVDSSGNRVGYAGLLPTDGVANVAGGMIDVNANGNSSNAICVAPPCSVTGSYTYNSATNVGHLTLASPTAMNFDFFVASGKAQSGTNNPLTIYAISTDVSNPAVVGTLVFQDSAPSPDSKYDDAAFNGSSVSALIGANANVSLTLGTTDGKGGFTGQFDQNNGGTEISDPPTSAFAYTYAASGTSGRYTFQMLGNPATKAPPLPFVLYASGPNRGFLLDQSSPAVITGTMSAQQGPKQNLGNFSNSLLTGTFAVATSSSSVSSIAPLTMNLLLTFNPATIVVGTENPGNQPVTGSFDIQNVGSGTITLTSPKTDYIIYAVDATHFYAIRDASKDSGATSPIFFMAQ